MRLHNPGVRELAAVVLVAFAATAQAATINLGAQGTYLENNILTDGVFQNQGPDNFTITNSSDTGVAITSVEINLGTSFGDAFFDTQSSFLGGWGSPFSVVADPGVGYTGVVGDTDGSTLLSLTFADFDPGETFAFSIDVDDDSLLRDVVAGFEIWNSEFSVTFEGAGFAPTTLVGTYVGDLATWPIDDAYATVSGAVETPIPEPATLALLGMAACGLAGAARRRRRAA